MRKHLATFLACLGALSILFGAGSLAGPPVASAQGIVPQPSPRPPVDRSGGSDRKNSAATATGHVTGTVIDVVTGVPVPGVAVVIGSDTVTTDENGNYDHWLPPGSYAVQVVPDPARGEPAQAPVMVEVQPGGLTLQHLGLRGAPAEAAVAPTVEVAQVPVGRSAAPVADDGAVPLAVEEAAEDSAPAEAAAAPDAPPAMLPRTGIEVDEGWRWIGAGLLLIALGWLVWSQTRQRPAPALNRPSRLAADLDEQALLEKLLTRSQRRR